MLAGEKIQKIWGKLMNLRNLGKSGGPGFPQISRIFHNFSPHFSPNFLDFFPSKHKLFPKGLKTRNYSRPQVLAFATLFTPGQLVCRLACQLVCQLACQLVSQLTERNNRRYSRKTQAAAERNQQWLRSGRIGLSKRPTSC